MYPRIILITLISVILCISCGDDSGSSPATSIPGCTDENALNYNPNATVDDGSCEYDTVIPGCTDPGAINFNPNANQDDGSCVYDDELHFQVSINGTGINQLIVFQTSIFSLNIGDEIGIYDENGITNFNDCSNVRGEILVGSGVWDGTQLDLVAIGSIDNCSFGGVQIPGYVDGNMPTIVIWDNINNIEKTAIVTYENGLDSFGDLLIIISDISFE